MACVKKVNVQYPSTVMRLAKTVPVTAPGDSDAAPVAAVRVGCKED